MKRRQYYVFPLSQNPPTTDIFTNFMQYVQTSSTYFSDESEGLVFYFSFSRDTFFIAFGIKAIQTRELKLYMLLEIICFLKIF